MDKFFTKGRIACLVIFSVLVIDQIIKIWIKTHMYWHESIRSQIGSIYTLPRIVVWLSGWKYLPNYS